MKFTESVFSTGMRLADLGAAERTVLSLGQPSAHRHDRNPLPRCSNGKVAQDLCNQPTNVGFCPSPWITHHHHNPHHHPSMLCNSRSCSWLFSICWMFWDRKKKKNFSKTILLIIERGHMSVHEWNWWFSAPLKGYLVWNCRPFLIKQATGCPESYEDTLTSASLALPRLCPVKLFHSCTSVAAAGWKIKIFRHDILKTKKECWQVVHEIFFFFFLSKSGTHRDSLDPCRSHWSLNRSTPRPPRTQNGISLISQPQICEFRLSWYFPLST